MCPIKVNTLSIIFLLHIYFSINRNMIYNDGKLGFNEMTSLQSNPERDPYSQCTPQQF